MYLTEGEKVLLVFASSFSRSFHLHLSCTAVLCHLLMQASIEAVKPVAYFSKHLSRASLRQKEGNEDGNLLQPSIVNEDWHKNIREIAIND